MTTAYVMKTLIPLHLHQTQIYNKHPQQTMFLLHHLNQTSIHIHLEQWCDHLESTEGAGCVSASRAVSRIFGVKCCLLCRSSLLISMFSNPSLALDASHFHNHASRPSASSRHQDIHTVCTISVQDCSLLHSGHQLAGSLYHSSFRRKHFSRTFPMTCRPAQHSMTYSLTTKAMRFLQLMLMIGFAQVNIEQELWNSTKDQVFFRISRRTQ